jgi:hypothetical protein
LNHAQSRAVFYGASWIEPFRFGQELNVGEFAPNLLEAEQGRFSYALEDGLADCAGIRTAFACSHRSSHVYSQD